MIWLIDKALRWKHTPLIVAWFAIFCYANGVIAAWRTRPHESGAASEFFLSFIVGLIIPFFFIVVPILACLLIAAFEVLIRATLRAIKEDNV